MAVKNRWSSALFTVAGAIYITSTVHPYWVWLRKHTSSWPRVAQHHASKRLCGGQGRLSPCFRGHHILLAIRDRGGRRDILVRVKEGCLFLKKEILDWPFQNIRNTFCDIILQAKDNFFLTLLSTLSFLKPHPTVKDPSRDHQGHLASEPIGETPWIHSQ